LDARLRRKHRSIIDTTNLHEKFPRQTTQRRRLSLNLSVNELDNKSDNSRRGDRRVFWSDSRGFPSVRLDARHYHPARGKGEKVKDFLLPLMILILMIELWMIFAPKKKVLLLKDYSDSKAVNARWRYETRQQ